MRQVIATKETGTEAPVKRIENCSFLYTRHLNMFFVALTRSNVNPALVFEYLFQLIRILKGYLGDEFDENAMRNNMTLIYELMDSDLWHRIHDPHKKASPSPRKQPLSFPHRISILFDSCSGLAHLHGCNPPVFHRDIKTANILLDRNGAAKLV